MVRLLFLALILTFGSVSALTSNILGDHQSSRFFIQLDQNDSLTTPDQVLDNLDNPLSSKHSIAPTNNQAYYYPQATFFFELNSCSNEPIRGPPST